MPTDLAPVPVSLCLYEQVPLGEMVGKDGEQFDIVAGLGRNLVADLRAKSLDETDVEIQRNTSDRLRFGEGSYEEWYAKGRVPFALVHQGTGALAALVFFGPKPLGRKSLKHLSAQERAQDERQMDAGEWHTLAFRSYAPFRGKGLMKPFVRAALAAYATVHPGARFWAAIQGDNAASQGLATALGFVVDEGYSDADEGHVVMVLDLAQSA